MIATSRMFEGKYEDAVRFARVASDQGYFVGQSILARCYEIGWGVEQNRKEYRRLTRAAALQGHAMSIRDMYDRYSNKIDSVDDDVMMKYYYACLYYDATKDRRFIDWSKRAVPPVGLRIFF